MANERLLTLGEIELAKSVYGDTIDYSKVVIFNEKHNPLQPTGRAMAPNGSIYYPPGNSSYANDISNGTLEQKWTFIHEMGHILQHQSGINVTFRGAIDQTKNTFGIEVYDYRDDLAASTPFHEWSIEAQASYFADVWYQREHEAEFGHSAPNIPSLSTLLAISPVRFFPTGRQCFLAETEVELWGGTTIQIEDVQRNNVVKSYGPDGRLKAGRVTQVFQHEVSHLLDVHGLRVTPGHVTLCGDGQFAGKHVPIIDILLSDGALVKEDASLVRMAINKPVGSLEDKFVKVSFAETSDDAQSGNLQQGEIRVGTLLFDREGEPVSILDCIRAEGMNFDPETGLVCREGQSPEPLYFFGPLPRPEDYILRRSRETLDGILADGEWEGSPSELIAQRLRRTASARLN